MSDTLTKEERFETNLDPARSHLVVELDESGDFFVEITHQSRDQACRFLSRREALQLRDWLNKVMP